LDFALAMENQDTPEGMAWLFKILDVKNDGFLDESTVMFFVKDCIIRSFAAGLDPIARSDVINEIFDMVNPKDKYFITLEDLQACKVGGIVLNMMIDFTGFHQYDQRPQEGGSN
jgi:serine/threonine-protein phosphatase 2A regulatory subunit B''